ncbi:hypothetical protein BO78DRAFT_232381 [Aspergillus sclerotiicarbonarius CBS 121057]|uniref:Uncharacterized protein n=1 Tax=Aspergillus sclerotiicarbonarius (strain CBS 121057 / IBT 28362) TaxID=1448318 RepID=A0A319E123_ASPSB|nr:hypothetical protein BO78DRAFT_232381 [Aspergillus sclerotiicarbonarius CBS 121057]
MLSGRPFPSKPGFAVGIGPSHAFAACYSYRGRVQRKISYMFPIDPIVRSILPGGLRCSVQMPRAIAPAFQRRQRQATLPRHKLANPRRVDCPSVSAGVAPIAKPIRPPALACVRPKVWGVPGVCSRSIVVSPYRIRRVLGTDPYNRMYCRGHACKEEKKKGKKEKKKTERGTWDVN